MRAATETRRYEHPYRLVANWAKRPICNWNTFYLRCITFLAIKYNPSPLIIKTQVPCLLGL